MDETFVRNRITELRLKKGVSEYRMSTDMGHSKNYIQGISSGRSLPSFSEFLYMCEYFGISPREFFDDGLKNPALLQEAIDGMKTLSDEDITLILGNIKRLQKK
jgi:transcriptional regulator with XRE-family HTH domain